MLLTVIRFVLYGVAALACWHSAIQTMQHFNRLSRRVAFLWWTLGAILILMMIVRSLGLDIWITDSLRESAQVQHWYARRHGSQAITLLLGLLCIATLVTGVHTILGSYSRILMAPVIGTAVLCVMELARFVSIHETDQFFGFKIGLPINWGVQVLAVVAILYGVRLSLDGEPVAPVKIRRSRPINDPEEPDQNPEQSPDKES